MFVADNKPQLTALVLEQRGDSADIDTLPGEVSSNVDDDVNLSHSWTPLGNCVGASEHASDLSITGLPSPDDYQLSRDDAIGNRQVLSPGMSLDNHQPADASLASIATGLPPGDV
jgi:hypothetical protein